MRRILAIDGGGIRGIFPASFLAAIEEELPVPIAQYFDLIAGTSTGGIIALGLGLGFTARDILNFYETLGPKVFKGVRFLRGARRLGYAAYSAAPLERALREQFGERLLGESNNRLVIPSVNLANGHVYIYKTAHDPRFEKDYKVPAVTVALATAAAPTYFPAHRASTGLPLVDGGMWANNPVGMAVVEAISCLDWPKRDLRVLSLGCTNPPLDIRPGRRLWRGMGFWGPKIADVFMTAQSSAACGTAAVLVGHDNLKRINPAAPKGRFSLDGLRDLDTLKGMGASEARNELQHLRPMFFGEPAEKFEPCHTPLISGPNRSEQNAEGVSQ